MLPAAHSASKLLALFGTHLPPAGLHPTAPMPAAKPASAQAAEQDPRQDEQTHGLEEADRVDAGQGPALSGARPSEISPGAGVSPCQPGKEAESNIRSVRERCRKRSMIRFRATRCSQAATCTTGSIKR